jgi:hypothetical protein
MIRCTKKQRGMGMGEVISKDLDREHTEIKITQMGDNKEQQLKGNKF